MGHPEIREWQGEEDPVEFATAPDKPDLTADDLRQVAELCDNNFYLEKTPAAV